MAGKINKKRKYYNRFLSTEESIPKTSAWRRKVSHKIRMGHSRVTESEKTRFYIENETVIAQELRSFDECTPIVPVTENMDTEVTNEPLNVFKDQGLGNSSSIHFENESEPLYPSSNLNVLEAFVSVLAFSLRFNLSQTCLQELLQLLELLLPPSKLPSSRHLFFKRLTSVFDNTCEVHLYCKSCKSHNCKFDEEVKPSICSDCQADFNADVSLKEGNFFLYMPLLPQLKVKFESHPLLEEMTKYKATKHVADIIDGSLYRSRSEDVQGDADVSLQFNIDGIPLYRKSRYDLWPIQCAINELSPLLRKKHIMVCGIWFGTEKPVMNEFLKPFTREMNELSTRGFKWHNEGKEIISRVFPVVCTSDAPARASIQNFKQYNGKFGCGFCESKGRRISKGNGNCRIFDVEFPLSPLRTFKSTMEHAENATEKNPVMGVKGPSILMELYPHFDMIEGFVPDYMHSVLLGVTRQFAHLWLDTYKQEYSLTSKSTKVLNSRIKRLKLPDEATRKLRPTTDVAFWKASEWRVFLIVSPVLLLNLINSNVYKHWLYFVHAISILLGSNIETQAVLNAELSLKKFICGVPSVYGEEELSYNVHLLLHLPDAVRKWGPLWSHSCFIFEDSLGKLKTLHHGTAGIPSQILTSYLNRSILKVLSEDVKNLQAISFVECMERRKRLTQSVTDLQECKLFGVGNTIPLTRIEGHLLQELLLNITDIPTKAEEFKRMLHSGCIYTSKAYSQKYTRANYAVSLLNGKVVEINRIIVLCNLVVLIGKQLIVTRFKRQDPDLGLICPYIFLIDNDPNDINDIVFQPFNIAQKFAIVSLQDSSYLLPIIAVAQQ